MGEMQKTNFQQPKTGKKPFLFEFEDISQLTSDQIKKLVEHLRLHQAKMKIQNEELLQFQAEIIQARDKYQELFDSTPVGYLILNTQNIILGANRMATKMLSTTREDLCQKRFTHFIPKDSQKTYYGKIIQVRKEHQPREFDLEMVREEHSRFLAHLHAVPVKDGEGKLSQVWILFEDVTERKKSKEALIESERIISEAQRIGHIGSWQWNLKTNEVYWSRGLYSIFGVNPNTFNPTNASFLGFIHPDDRRSVDGMINQTLDAGKRENHRLSYNFKRWNSPLYIC